MVVRLVTFLLFVSSLVVGQDLGDSPTTDSEIKRLIIQQSIRSYSGSCPCPYNYDKAGRRCGGRSAYSRPGGASPICYEEQISDALIESYRKRFLNSK